MNRSILLLQTLRDITITNRTLTIILLDIASEVDTMLYIDIKDVYNFGNRDVLKNSIELEKEVKRKQLKIDKWKSTVSNLCKDLCKETLEEQEKNVKSDSKLDEERKKYENQISVLRKEIVNYEHLNAVKMNLAEESENLQYLLNSEREKIQNLQKIIKNNEKVNELNKKIENLLHKEREKFEDKIQDLEKKIQEYEQQNEWNRNLKEDCTKLQDLLNAEMLKNEETKQNLEEMLKQKELQRECEISTLESQIKTLREKVQNLSMLESYNADLETKIKNLLKELDDKKDELQQLQEKNNAAAAETNKMVEESHKREKILHQFRKKEKIHESIINNFKNQFIKLRKSNLEQNQKCTRIHKDVTEYKTETNLKIQNFEKERYIYIFVTI